MGIDKKTLSVAKKYTKETASQFGALKGASCQISDISEIEGGKRITFLWENSEGATRESTLVVLNGADGADGSDGRSVVSADIDAENHLILTMSDSSTVDCGEVPTAHGAKGDKGDSGEDGFSPTITIKVSTSEQYILTITTKDGEFDTPNLKGGGGSGGASSMSDLSDVTLTSLKTGQILKWDGSNWVNEDGVEIDSLGDIGDVDLASLSDGQVIAWDATNSKWVNVNLPTVPTKTSELTNDSNFITKAVNDLVNYYLKSETYDKTEVDQLIAAVKNSRFEVVATLPTTDIKTNVIYLVPKSTAQTSNVKDEYINLDGTTSGWEKIGDTEIDLSNYVTITMLNNALADYVTSSDFATELANYTTTADLNTLLANKADASTVTALSNRTNAKFRRTRRNITSDLTNLPTAIAEQDLESYGYSIGEYFVGASGYKYHLADMNPFYGGYSSYAVVDIAHIGIVVQTGATSKWNDTDSTSTGYSGSALHSYLTTTVLNNIKSDMIALFGGTTGLEHLLSHQKLLTNAVSSWAWQTDQYISALSEVQVYSSRIWGIDGYQTGEACKPLQIFQKYRFNEVFGNIWFWLRDIMSASSACRAGDAGYANRTGASAAGSVVGLILFH